MVNDERSQQVWSGDDAISTLPLELLLQITKDLYPADIIRIQRVSKRWREIFSKYAIITSALHQTLEFLGLKNANAAVSDAITYFRWEHGLRSARPVKKIFLPWSTPRRPQEVFYHSRRLCYRVSDRSNEVHMLDLETGERSTWSDEARDVSGSIGLSDRFLAMITTVGMFSTVSLVTVWDVRTSQRWVKQLPCPIDRITIEGDKVVIPCGGNKWKPRPSWRKRLRILSPEEGPIRVFGDHEVFGLASDDGAQLWFFNPNFVPDVPNAHPFLAMEESG
ncbi:hypothetical protein VTN49DRAFT_6603 [Thermomyces lanuginosus]|uniref:uncharacterized protein n=1 Tax=Thermomyces lanuginosus TaxID=5541 RepID=UPI0037420369